MMTIYRSNQRAAIVAALFILVALQTRIVLAAGLVLPGGETDPNCPDLRRWLQSDAGIQDTASHVTVVFDNDHRIEGNLGSGWRGSGPPIPSGGTRPAIRCLTLDCSPSDVPPQSNALLEFHNGDRIWGTLCGYRAASTKGGKGVSAKVLVRPFQEFGNSAEKPIGVATDWIRRIVFDAAGPSRRCPPRSLVCCDGRVLAFRVLRFNEEDVSLLTDKGFVRRAYRDLAEVAMQPMDAWEAYHRQLAALDPKDDADIVRLETGQGMVLTTSTSRAVSIRNEAWAGAPACVVAPVWSDTPIPVAWSAVRTVWRAPATVVPLSLMAPRQVTQRDGLGSSWKWQTDRNVAGGELRSGDARYLWGFGVHAPNEMVFQLPDSARAFRSGLGIDAAVGDSGCVVAKVFVGEASGARPCSKASRSSARVLLSPPARSRECAALRRRSASCWS